MVTDNIDDTELLGRCCFDSREAGRKHPRTRFIERSFDRGPISVDRLGEADIQSLAGLHDLEGQGRNPPKNFHGWYVFLAKIVRSVGWQVKPQRTKDNEWHAEVRRSSRMEDRDAFKQHCQKLATNSNWKPRPMTSSDEEFLDRIADKLN